MIRKGKNKKRSGWQGEEVALRGVAALGGEGFNLVRYSPALWAEKHYVKASPS